MKLNLKKKKSKTCVYIFLSLTLIVILYSYFNQSNVYENFENYNNIELVIARYNENLNWLKDDPFNRYPSIVYNKGNNDEFYKGSNIKSTIKLNNVGKCDHTYLYHIISHYDDLANMTLFIPGSLDMKFKYDKAKRLLSEVENHNDTVFIGNKHENVKKELYNFALDNWKTSNEINAVLNPETKIEHASIRPFGKWYEAHFPNVKSDFISYSGIIAISRADIIKHPKSYYEDLIKELDKTSNPEAGHYFERAWHAIFYPYNNAKFIEGFLNRRA